MLANMNVLELSRNHTRERAPYKGSTNVVMESNVSTVTYCYTVLLEAYCMNNWLNPVQPAHTKGLTIPLLGTRV